MVPLAGIAFLKNSSHKRQLATFARLTIFVIAVLKLNKKIIYVSSHLFLGEINIIPIIIFFLPQRLQYLFSDIFGLYKKSCKCFFSRSGHFHLRLYTRDVYQRKCSLLYLNTQILTVRKSLLAPKAHRTMSVNIPRMFGRIFPQISSWTSKWILTD